MAALGTPYYLRLSLVAEAGDTPPCGAWAPSLWLPMLPSRGSRQVGLGGCSPQAQQLWHTGLVAPWHVRSSWTRDRTCGPCTGKWALNPWTSREAPASLNSLVTLLIPQGLFCSSSVSSAPFFSILFLFTNAVFIHSVDSIGRALTLCQLRALMTEK